MFELQPRGASSAVVELETTDPLAWFTSFFLSVCLPASCENRKCPNTRLAADDVYLTARQVVYEFRPFNVNREKCANRKKQIFREKRKSAAFSIFFVHRGKLFADERRLSRYSPLLSNAKNIIPNECPSVRRPVGLAQSLQYNYYCRHAEKIRVGGTAREVSLDGGS